MRTGVRGDTETIAIRVSKTLLKKIDLSAAYENTSRGEFIVHLIEANISNVNQCVEITPVRTTDDRGRTIPLPPTPKSAQFFVPNGISTSQERVLRIKFEKEKREERIS